MKKKKLTDKQFLLVVNGPSCGGKSSVVNLIFDRYGGIYNAKRDAIKWLISDYDFAVHRDLVNEMTLETLRLALQAGLSVLKDGASDAIKLLLEIAKECNVSIFVANVSAPDHVLAERFAQRVAAKKQGARISNVSQERFQAINEAYRASKVETPLEFDSSLKTPEEIVEEIVAFIIKNT